MQEQLEKQSVSGQGLNSNFKILLLVIISFSLGMMAKSYLSPNHIPQREIHYTQEQKLEIADQQLRKTIFYKNKRTKQ